MAVGYSRTATVQVLLDYGADPEVADKEGRTVVDLVEKLRAAMPLTPELLGRRTMLEDVAGVLTGTLVSQVLWKHHFRLFRHDKRLVLMLLTRSLTTLTHLYNLVGVLKM